MARRKILTDRMIRALPRTDKRRAIADPELRGHYLRIPPTGAIAFTVIVKKGGRQTWESIGTSADLSIEAAREKARAVIRRIKSGEAPPMAPQSTTAVAQAWLQRHVDKNSLRSAYELRRIIGRYITPLIGDRDFVRLRRSDITAFIDAIEDKHGAATADACLTTLRTIASWVQSRSDDYVPPFSRGMARRSKAQRQRSRILTDDELRIVWRATEDAGTLGAIVRLLLFTAQRRAKVYWMRWQDISPDGVWSIPAEPGEKGNGGRLKLPPAALAIIHAQPHFASSPYVFAHRPGTQTVSAFHDRCGIPDWRLHDLRRTSRSLLSRIGIAHDVAEAILGHTLPGISAVYNRDCFEPQKAAALAKLANTIGQIVDPINNVVPLHEVAS
jgi:integrase